LKIDTSDGDASVIPSLGPTAGVDGRLTKFGCFEQFKEEVGAVAMDEDDGGFGILGRPVVGFELELLVVGDCFLIAEGAEVKGGVDIVVAGGWWRLMQCLGWDGFCDWWDRGD